jgi:alkylation response protein AidB-like acyl-CoA dehydrogenase
MPPSVDELRRLCRGDLEAGVEEIEATGRLPEDVIDRLGQMGAWRLGLPPEHGGLGLALSQLVPYLEAAAEGPAPGRMLVHLANGIWRPIHRYGQPAQRDLLDDMGAGRAFVAFALTEASGGTGRDLHSRARLAGDKWLLEGEKHLITFADRATHFLLTVASDDRRAPDSLTTFLVPRDALGLEIDCSQGTMGLHGTGHGFLRYQDLALPDTARVGAVGQGLEVALHFLDYSRLSLSACMVGLAQRALEESVAFAHRRVTFGRPIAERQAIQGHLARMQAVLAAGRALVREAATAYDAAAGAGRLGSEDLAALSATTKLYCLEMVGEVTDRALRVHGGWGYTTEAPIERIYRDARGFWFEEGTAEIQSLVVARHLLHP